MQRADLDRAQTTTTRIATTATGRSPSPPWPPPRRGAWAGPGPDPDPDRDRTQGEMPRGQSGERRVIAVITLRTGGAAATRCPREPNPLEPCRRAPRSARTSIRDERRTAICIIIIIIIVATTMASGVDNRRGAGGDLPARDNVVPTTIRRNVGTVTTEGAAATDVGPVHARGRRSRKTPRVRGGIRTVGGTTVAVLIP